MGEDLSVTLRCLPLTQRLVIIPDIIYNYRIGGETSRFMPDMLNDFLALYDNKVKLIYEYDMPQDAMFNIKEKSDEKVYFVFYSSIFWKAAIK